MDGDLTDEPKMTEFPRLASPGSVPRSLALTAVRLFRSPAWPWVVLRIILIAVVPIFVALYHDIGRHYLWLPDSDVLIVVNALLINDGLAHAPRFPGFGHFLVLGNWFSILDLLGVVDVSEYGQIPPPPGSEAVFQELVVWARVLSVLITIALGVSILYFTQVLTGSRYYAFLAALAFSGTQSFNTHVVAMRPDVTAVVLSYLAIIAILHATKRDQTQVRAVAGVVASAFLALFAMYTKTSVLPLILLVPAFAVVFAFEARVKPPRMQASAVVVAALFVFALVLAYLTLTPLFAEMGTRAYVYNGFIVLYVLGCIAAFAVLRGLSPRESVHGLAAVVVGLGLAQLLLTTRGYTTNTHAVANHIDYLASFARSADMRPDAEGFPYVQIAVSFVSNLAGVFKDGFANFCWVCRRTSMIYLLVLLAAVYLIASAGRYVRVRIAFLTVAFVFVEMVLRFHAFNNQYRMYVEGFLFAIAAFGLLQIVRGRSLRVRKVVDVVSGLFVVWFWVDDVNRKMLYPTFAFHTGDICIQRQKFPQLAAHFDRYCAPGGDMAGPEAIKPWIHDTREAFLWTDRPWRTPEGFVWKSSPIAIPGN